MSTVLTDTPANANFAAGPTYPTNGDSGTVWWNILRSSVQQLADRTKALSLGAPGAVPNTKVPVSLGGLIPSPGPSWAVTTSGSVPACTQLVTSSNAAWFPLDRIMPGVKIVGAVMSWTKDGGGHSLLPVNMPTLSLRHSRNGTVTTIATVTDPSASVAAFETAHDVTLTCNHVVLTDKSYYLVVTGETGTNSAANNDVIDLFVIVSPA